MDGAGADHVGRDDDLEARGPHVAELQHMLARFGYAADITHRYDQSTREVITAFQRHFRPACVDGITDTSTMTRCGAC